MESQQKQLLFGAGAMTLLGLSGMMLYRNKGSAKTVRPLIESCILSIDQGTTSSRVLVIDHNLKVLDVAQREHNQISSKPGWVEHDVEEIYQNVAACLNEVCQRNGLTSKNVKGIGITNQRETTVAFDKVTGKSFHNAIVWLDQRTAGIVE